MITPSRPADTSPEAWQVYLDTLRTKTPGEKIQMVFELNATVRQLSIAGIRQRHPDWSDDQVHLEVLRLTVDEATYQDYCRWRENKR